MNIEVNDIVDYHSVIGGPITSREHKVVSLKLEPNNYGCDVAWITRRSACVAVEALSLNREYLYELEDSATCPHGFLVGCKSCENKEK